MESNLRILENHFPLGTRWFHVLQTQALLEQSVLDARHVPFEQGTWCWLSAWMFKALNMS